MSDTGYQPYCEKCGAPVVWCTCLDDIDWSLEMRSHLGRVRLEQQVKELRAELARRDASLLTEGEQKEILSYIRGNYDRDKIPTWLLDLIDGIARRDEIIKQLKEDEERC